MDPGASWKNALVAGCSFGPTSAGIAMNVLSQCNVLQTPVGQLVIAAAIVDDILALVILSQLQVFTKNSSVSLVEIVLPIASAILWLIVGGTFALFIFPNLHMKLIDLLAKCKSNSLQSSQISLLCLFILLFVLLPATYYTRASYLMGAFLSGLAFCQDSTGLDTLFRRQFKQVMTWLMKIFFASTIGFQVPIRSFTNGKVIKIGFFFTLALLGKFAVGLLTPNFHDKTTVRQFRGIHLRDCVLVGLSMMGEAEFAFIVALFGFTEGLVPPDIYSSIVFAILMSSNFLRHL